MKFYYQCSKCGTHRAVPAHTFCGRCCYQAALTGPSTAETLVSLINTSLYRGHEEVQFVVVVHATSTLNKFRYVVTQDGTQIAQGDDINDVLRNFCVARAEGIKM